ncbi:MAG: GNAT family N-acetyltransferase [Alphaproteobacteria bacterium]|nr:GNAT family N-acetyltransferase [Alphaproteobacteria bacterium]
MAEHLPVPSFNAVVGLQAGDEGELEAVLAWYREHDVATQVEIVPGLEDAKLLAALTRLGYYQSGFHASVIARPRDAAAPDPAVDVVRVTSADELEDFLDAYVTARRIPDGEGFKRNVRPWLHEPGWSLWLGRHDGKPVAEAILYLRDGFAYLADAATTPALRGRGLQSALLAHRLRHAANEGAEFACSGASFLSTSHRNMVRAGMRLQFVRALWTAV